MAKYLILIYGNEQRWDSMTPAQQERLEAGHRAFHAKAGTAVLTGTALEPTIAATSLRAGSDPEHPAITDGPFLETKEAVGGFYVVQAPDLDAVIALAKLLPEVADDHSGVEIRPLQGAN